MTRIKQLALSAMIHRTYPLTKDLISHNSTGELVFFFIATSVVTFKSEFSQEKFKDHHFNAPKAQIKNTGDVTCI